MFRQRVHTLSMRRVAIFTSATVVGLIILIVFRDNIAHTYHDHLSTMIYDRSISITKTGKDSVTHRETDSFTRAYRDSMVIENCVADYLSKGRLDVNLTTKLQAPLPFSFGFLTPDSFVIGVGGFKGTEGTSYIIENYDPWMVIFEPMPNYAKELRMKFRTRPKISVVEIGFHDVDTNTFFNDTGDSTSFFHTGQQTGMPVKLRNGTRILEKLGLNAHPVDLLQVDCEGCEFNLMEELIRLKWVQNMRYIYLEVHSKFPGVKHPVLRYCAIRAELSKTHITLSQSYGPKKKVWVDLWALKEINALYYLPRNITALMTDLET